MGDSLAARRAEEGPARRIDPGEEGPLQPLRLGSGQEAGRPYNTDAGGEGEGGARGIGGVGRWNGKGARDGRAPSPLF